MANREIVTTQSFDNFAVAAAVSTGAIVGERLRFSKGRYLVGKGDHEQLPLGTVLQAIDVQAAWVRFEDGRIVDQRVGYPMCDREELGDTDQEAWPRGFDGEPADPWANQRYLYLINPANGRDFTFITSSWGGRGAVEGLVRQVGNKRRYTPGALARVKLETVFRQSLKYGAIPGPKFTIVGWDGVDGSVAAERALPDDEIPF